MAMSDSMDPRGDGEAKDFSDDDAPFGDAGADAGPDQPAELALDDDVRLPWLEGDEEEEDYGGGGGQLAMLLLLALAALVLIVGGIWWFTRDGSDEELVADGSVIEAPAEPYKTRPADPGGKEFEGTGDTSFAVSEGEARPAQLGGQEATSEPGFASVKPTPTIAPAPKPTQATVAPAETPAPSGPAVQVGAYSTRAGAEAGWSRLSSQHSVLQGQRYRVVEGRADIGTVFRLQALPGDMAAARKLCSDLKSAGQDCSVKN